MIPFPGISLLNTLTRPIPHNKVQFGLVGIMKHKSAIFENNTTLWFCSEIVVSILIGWVLDRELHVK